MKSHRCAEELVWIFVLALLPGVVFVPWLGWVLIEELDLIAGSALLLLFACWNHSGPHHRPTIHPGVFDWKVQGTIGVVALLLVAFMFGFIRTVGLRPEWTWFHATPYVGVPGAIRLVKAGVWFVVLAAPWFTFSLANPNRAAKVLTHGFTIGLLLCGVSVVRERLAFSGLTDFTEDYRATGAFWEMHVGGAALDAYLAMASPFALVVLATTKRVWMWVVAAVASLTAVYSSLVTFSRAAALALAVSLLTTLLLLLIRSARKHGIAANGARKVATDIESPCVQPFFVGAVVIVATALGSWLLFSGAGYRGVLAWVGAVMLMLPLGSSITVSRQISTAKVVAWSAALTLPVLLLAWLTLKLDTALIPKLPYVVYGVCWLLLAIVLVLIDKAPQLNLTAPAIAIWSCLAIQIPVVVVYWGGPEGVVEAIFCAAVLWLLPLSQRFQSVAWPSGFRSQANLGLFVIVVAVCIAALSGGRFLADRFAAAGKDLAVRQGHWALLLDAVNRDYKSTMVGLGIGQMPGVFRSQQSDPTKFLPGSFAIEEDPAGSGPALALMGSRNATSWGMRLRVSQELDLADDFSGPVLLMGRLKPLDAVASLDIELCNRHLIYPRACSFSHLRLPLAPGSEWLDFQVVLSTSEITRGSWVAPRSTVLSLQIPSGPHRLLVDDLRLVDSSGRSLLENGDFSRGAYRWFFSSDQGHHPWNAQSLPVHLMVEFGITGLAVTVLLGAWAVFLVMNVMFRSRDHRLTALAAALGGSLIGVLVVGFTDAVLNTARISFLLLFAFSGGTLILSLQTASAGGLTRRFTR